MMACSSSSSNNNNNKNDPLGYKSRSLIESAHLGHYSSNHVLVNRERERHGKPLLYRSLRLDDLARQHAQNIATRQAVQPSVQTIEQLQGKLHATFVGENTLRGDSIRAIHQAMMADPSARRNLLSSTFVEFGMGTAKGADGRLYLVQLFTGGEPYFSCSSNNNNKYDNANDAYFSIEFEGKKDDDDSYSDLD